jgi:hypothetical protein
MRSKRSPGVRATPLRTGLKLHFGNSDVLLENTKHLEQLQRVFRLADRNGMALVVHARSTIDRNRPYGALSPPVHRATPARSPERSGSDCAPCRKRRL